MEDKRRNPVFSPHLVPLVALGAGVIGLLLGVVASVGMALW